MGLATRTDSLAASVEGLTTRTDSLAASVEGLTTRTDSLAASVEGLTRRTDSLAASVESLGRKVDTLVEVQADQHTRLVCVEDSFVLLVQMAKLNEERLDAFGNRFSEFDERLARKVDTLVEVQADQHTRLVRVEDSFVLLVQLAKLTDERIDAFENRFRELVEWLGGKVDTVVEVQANQHPRLVRVEDSVVLLVELAKLTDERVDAFENRFSELVEWLGGRVNTPVEVQSDQQTRLVRVEDSFVLLVQLAKLNEERLDAFENRFSEFGERFSDIGARLITSSEQIATLPAVQSHSDERLNTLMDVVERYISHNGGNANE